MMSHFEKLNTRLRSVQKYPTVDAQNRRFQQLGWTSISTRNLWELWASSDFLSPSERKSLDIIEPFDEWEEFALFGCHYFLLVADNGGIKAASRHSSTQKEIEVEKPSSYELPILSEELDIVFTQHPKGCGCARFGAVLPLRSSIKKQLRFGNHAGMGLNTRTDSFDVFALSENAKLGVDSELQLPPIRPSSRMCHTITDMEDGTSLLVGGRASPDKGIMDCWVYHKWVGIWEPVESLPYPLYRHQAIYLGNGCVLVSTGRINSRDLSKHYLVWSRGLGWVQCRQDGENKPVSTYGSIFSSKLCGSISKKCGLKVGGLSDDAVIQADPWYWELDAYDTKVFIRMTEYKKKPFQLTRP
jgi:tRNA wybutosine-synthesizing protein 4